MSPNVNSRLAGEFADRVGVRFGKLFREMCVEAGVSQSELWRRSGVSRDTLNRIAAGKANPTLHLMARLAFGLRMREEDFLKELVKRTVQGVR